MKRLLLVGLSCFAVSAAAAETVRATVNGMVCAFCAQGIEKRLAKMPAAQEVFVDLKARVVAVESKPGQTLDQNTISAEITDAGYDVVKLEVVDKPVAQIRKEAKARQ